MLRNHKPIMTEACVVEPSVTFAVPQSVTAGLPDEAAVPMMPPPSAPSHDIEAIAAIASTQTGRFGSISGQWARDRHAGPHEHVAKREIAKILVVRVFVAAGASIIKLPRRHRVGCSRFAHVVAAGCAIDEWAMSDDRRSVSTSKSAGTMSVPQGRAR